MQWYSPICRTKPLLLSGPRLLPVVPQMSTSNYSRPSPQVMISFKMDKQLQTISNYFLFSLAVADFIIGEQTQHLPSFSTNQVWNFSVWLEKNAPCFSTAFPLLLACCSSLGFLSPGDNLGMNGARHILHSLPDAQIRLRGIL